MTKKQALKIYGIVFPDDATVVEDASDNRRDSIAQEIADIVKAKTMAEAKEIIWWWGWNDETACLRAVKKIRKLAEEIRTEGNADPALSGSFAAGGKVKPMSTERHPINQCHYGKTMDRMKYEKIAADLNDNGDTEKIAAALREIAAQAYEDAAGNSLEWCLAKADALRKENE